MIKILENLNESKKAKKKKSSLEKFLDKHEIKAQSGSIGFSEKEQKWYGWSHRAIHGFKVGDKCKDGDCGVGDGYTFKNGDVLKTIDDCKQRAKDFAKSVD